MEHVSELLGVLPFSHLMDAERYLTLVSVECVDLVLTGRRASILNLRQQYQRHNSNAGIGNDNDAKRHRKVLFLASCMENYATGLCSKEKAELLEGFLSTTICDLVHEERDRVKYFQFLCEDLLSPATMVLLQAQDSLAGKEFNHDISQVVYLPPEFGFTNDSEGDDSELKENSTMQHHAEGTHTHNSSFARKATSWYAPSESYVTRFSPAIASVLEECRRILVGLHMSLHRRVQQLVLSNWKNESTNATSSTDTEPRSCQAQYRFGVAYWALVLRDALFALLFYSKQHFRWEGDRSMQARFMVLQMMLYDENGSPEQFTKASNNEGKEVVELLVSLESANRNVSGVVCSGAIFSMRLHFPVASSNESKWLRRAQLRSRTWLQKVQWLQITGDVLESDDLYRKYSRVNDLFLQYREFLISKLAPTAMKDSMSTTAAAAVPKKASQLPSQQLHPTPLLDTHNRALAARSTADALHNRSTFAHDTLWIPPVLELSSSPSSEPAPATGKRNQQLERMNEAEADNSSKPLTTSPSPCQQRRQHQRVVMRVFKPDLTQAIEAAVLTIGVIHDDDALKLQWRK